MVAPPSMPPLRTLASLEHPSIVPVHDVGHTDDGMCYVVSKCIEGRDLQQVKGDDPPNITQSVTIAVVVAEALDYAHRLGLVHSSNSHEVAK